MESRYHYYVTRQIIYNIVFLFKKLKALPRATSKSFGKLNTRSVASARTVLINAVINYNQAKIQHLFWIIELQQTRKATATSLTKSVMSRTVALHVL